MKKTLLSLSLVAVSAASAFAQGTVVFKNDSTSIITNGAVRAPLSSLTVGLYAGAQGANSNALVLLGTTTINVTAGRFQYNVGDGSLTNTFIGPGATGTFQVRVWSGAFASYEAAYAAALVNGTTSVGASAVWEMDTANPNAAVAETIPTLGGNGMTPVVAITLTPEPGTIALGVLGVGSLLALRRRKS